MSECPADARGTCQATGCLWGSRSTHSPGCSASPTSGSGTLHMPMPQHRCPFLGVAISAHYGKAPKSCSLHLPWQAAGPPGSSDTWEDGCGVSLGLGSSPSLVDSGASQAECWVEAGSPILALSQLLLLGGLGQSFPLWSQSPVNASFWSCDHSGPCVLRCHNFDGSGDQKPTILCVEPQ